MKDVLKRLNSEVGVKGSMILTQDGIVIASDLGTGLQEERLAAISSSAIKGINAAIEPVEREGFHRFSFISAHGKMVILRTGDAYLVVVLEPSIKLDVTLIAIVSAARKVSNLGQIRI